MLPSMILQEQCALLALFGPHLKKLAAETSAARPRKELRTNIGQALRPIARLSCWAVGWEESSLSLAFNRIGHPSERVVGSRERVGSVVNLNPSVWAVSH